MPQKTSDTPMMQQYNAIKAQYPDAFLFYRIGDFYELFNDDAIKGAQLLELTLTARNKSADDPIPMAGVPHHAVQSYVDILIDHGYKVAICEQMEDPKKAVGMVKRAVIQQRQIITLLLFCHTLAVMPLLMAMFPPAS